MGEEENDVVLRTLEDVSSVVVGAVGKLAMHGPKGYDKEGERGEELAIEYLSTLQLTQNLHRQLIELFDKQLMGAGKLEVIMKESEKTREDEEKTLQKLKGKKERLQEILSTHLDIASDDFFFILTVGPVRMCSICTSSLSNFTSCRGISSPLLQPLEVVLYSPARQRRDAMRTNILGHLNHGTIIYMHTRLFFSTQNTNSETAAPTIQIPWDAGSESVMEFAGYIDKRSP